MPEIRNDQSQRASGSSLTWVFGSPHDKGRKRHCQRSDRGVEGRRPSESIRCAEHRPSSSKMIGRSERVQLVSLHVSSSERDERQEYCRLHKHEVIERSGMREA